VTERQVEKHNANDEKEIVVLLNLTRADKTHSLVKPIASLNAIAHAAPRSSQNRFDCRDERTVARYCISDL